MAKHRIDNWSSDWEAEIGIPYAAFIMQVKSAGHDTFGVWGDEIDDESGVWNTRGEACAERLFDDLKARHEAAQQAPQATTETAEPRATASQVNYIMSLLIDRERSGEGGGYFYGPTDRAGVERMSKGAASAYIDSLKGRY